MFVSNTEEFAKEINVGNVRWNEIEAFMETYVLKNEDVSVKTMMRACIEFAKDSMEIMLMGVLLGRMVQAEECDKCRSDPPGKTIIAVSPRYN